METISCFLFWAAVLFSTVMTLFIKSSKTKCFPHTALPVIVWRWEAATTYFCFYFLQISNPAKGDVKLMELRYRMAVETNKSTLMFRHGMEFQEFPFVLNLRAHICQRSTMEEDMLSIVSNGGGNATPEAADSNSSTHLLPPPSKRTKQGGFRVSSTRFKGLVPHQNGHWGAQIYANHQRIWLGTFKSEKEAAMAYDSAAIRLRSGDSHRNFPWTSVTVEEPKFQEAFTTDALLGMIKDGSYPSKFDEYLRSRFQTLETDVCRLNLTRIQSKGLLSKQLFQKELTPSDVGKLNRLVIPKKCALKYFPRIEDDADNDVELTFYDITMRSWKFRYCYWSSSQSFVFTRGWNRFVKEKRLRENDTISFYLCECQEGENAVRTFTAIHVSRVEGISGGFVKGGNSNEMQTLGSNLNFQIGLDNKDEILEKEAGGEREDQVMMKAKTIPEAGDSGFWLFGVKIVC